MIGGVVIAAPGSGSGKTMVATGLLGALRGAGHTPAPFKVGPDFIDPGYHALAAGRPGRNLDPVLVGDDLIGPLYRHGTLGADIAVVEGVMGLFDGRIPLDVDDPASARPRAAGSTAEVAVALGLPVVLVIDARGMSQSLAALITGFVAYDPRIRIGGVILNRVGSPRHEQVLRAACVQAGVDVLGVIPRMPAVDVPERHLGLLTARENSGAKSAVTAMASIVAEHVDLERMVAVARTARPLTGEIWDPVTVVGGSAFVAADEPVTVAMAGGPAFSFGYAEHVELLTAAGARVVDVDPRHDRLPADTGALIIPGGFPEVHAEALADNVALHDDVRRFADAGGVIHAECAGLLYLGQTLDDRPMAGVLPTRARFGPRLTLGYRDAVATSDSVLYRVGERVTGHEFHRTTVASDTPGATAAWAWRTDAGPATEGFVAGIGVPGTVHASYLHVHPAGGPRVIARLVAAARAARRSPDGAPGRR